MSSSSASKKKRPPIQKCHLCDCFFFAKDIDEHRIGQQTPKGPRPKQTEAAEENQCKPADFAQCQFAMVRPHFGLTLRLHNGNPTADSAAYRWESLFPVPLCGWTRYNSALVHPETLSIAGIRPRSAVLRLSSRGDYAGQLLSLWPSAEVPPLRILLPNSEFSRDCSSILARLAILPVSSLHISKMSLQPNLSTSELPLEQWTKLAHLSHFQLFIRSYFCDAFFYDQFDELALFYYGRRLIFCVSDMEFESVAGQHTLEKGNGETESEMSRRCGDGAGKDTAAGECNRQSAAKVRRFSPMCEFDIRWDELWEESGRQNGEESDNLC